MLDLNESGKTWLFEIPGTFTWIKPRSGSLLFVTVQPGGAGGGGGACGDTTSNRGGGGGGGAARAISYLVPLGLLPDVLYGVVGAGGAGGAGGTVAGGGAGSAGTAGTQSSLGVYMPDGTYAPLFNSNGTTALNSTFAGNGGGAGTIGTGGSAPMSATRCYMLSFSLLTSPYIGNTGAGNGGLTSAGSSGTQSDIASGAGGAGATTTGSSFSGATGYYQLYSGITVSPSGNGGSAPGGAPRDNTRYAPEFGGPIMAGGGGGASTTVASQKGGNGGNGMYGGGGGGGGASCNATSGDGGDGGKGGDGFVYIAVI